MSQLILHENQMTGNEIVRCDVYCAMLFVMSAKILPVQKNEEAEHY
jgi:hypothetical protein